MDLRERRVMGLRSQGLGDPGSDEFRCQVPGVSMALAESDQCRGTLYSSELWVAESGRDGVRRRNPGLSERLGTNEGWRNERCWLGLGDGGIKER